MDRHHVALLAVLVVAAAAVAVPVAAATDAGGSSAGNGATVQATTSDTATASGENATASGENGSVAPGQRLSGVVGVQRAELDGELDQRSLHVRTERASSNASKADVVATQINEVRDRLQQLRARQDRLRTARQTGNISRGEYRARMAVVAAEIRSTRGLIDATENVSRDLPAEALDAHGVDRSELDHLRQDADAMHGREVSEIAHDIAGESPGRELAPGRNVTDSAGETGGNETARGTPSRSTPDGRSTGANRSAEHETRPPVERGRSSNSTATGADASGNEHGGGGGAGNATARAKGKRDEAAGSERSANGQSTDTGSQSNHAGSSKDSVESSNKSSQLKTENGNYGDVSHGSKNRGGTSGTKISISSSEWVPYSVVSGSNVYGRGGEAT